MPTILSRCQLIRIPALPTVAITKALVDRAGLDPDQAAQLAGLSDGNYREALQSSQHADEDWQDLLREWLRVAARKDLPGQIKWIDEMAKLGREKQKQLLRYFTHLAEQSIRLRVMGNESSFAASLPSKEFDFSQRLNKLLEINQLQAFIEETDKAAYYIERNANGKMLFHALTIKLFHIIADKSLILVN